MCVLKLLFLSIYIYIKPDPLLVLSQKIKTFADFKTLNGHKIIEINM